MSRCPLLAFENLAEPRPGLAPWPGALPAATELGAETDQSSELVNCFTRTRARFERCLARFGDPPACRPPA